MAPGSIAEQLGRPQLVHLDARILALHLLGEGPHIGHTREVIAAMRDGRVRAQTSVITLYQLLAEIYRRRESAKAAALARDLTVHAGLQLVPTSAEIAVQAAEVRAQLGGRPERAIQIATALVAGADVYLTQGSGLRRIAGMTVANLEDFALPEGTSTPPVEV